MAKLSYGNMCLEIRYKEMDPQNWIQYEIYFLYKGEPMIQDSQLKRTSGNWLRRSPGAFRANECDHDKLIDILQKALDTDEPVFYEPTEPGFILGVYPNKYFPFIPHNWKVIWASDEAIQAVEDYELLREVAGGRLSGDPFTIIMMVDVYNYGEERAYHGAGPAMILIVRRHDLRAFIEALREEYTAFCETWGIGPREDREDLGDDPVDLSGLLDL